jgi:hypothetical protein
VRKWLHGAMWSLSIGWLGMRQGQAFENWTSDCPDTRRGFDAQQCNTHPHTSSKPSEISISFFWALDYRNFWKFYLIRTSFTLGELVSLVKVFRLFRLERFVLVFRVWTQ